MADLTNISLTPPAGKYSDNTIEKPSLAPKFRVGLLAISTVPSTPSKSKA
jgi:hypothetical protein